MEQAEVEVQIALARIKQKINTLVGSKLRFKTNLGRCRVHEAEGFIKEVYPNLFVVYFDNGYERKCVSYTYIDVLTKTVEIYDCQTGNCLFPWIN
jgi:uncharacterized protein Veg